MLKILLILLISINIWAKDNEGTQVAPVSNPGVITIGNPSTYDKIYAISDVHGMADKLHKLLTATGLIQDRENSFQWAKGKALFIVVGDSIDKGDKAIEVLQFWIQLEKKIKAAGGRFVHTLGNHEATFMADSKSPKVEMFKDEIKAQGLKTKEFLNSELGQFMRGMPVALIVGDWIFCHSGRIPKNSLAELKADSKSDVSDSDHFSKEIFQADNSILNAKDWWAQSKDRESNLKRLESWGLFGVIFGHQDSAFGSDKNIISDETQRMIKIETGMNPTNVPSRPGKILEISNPKEMKGSQVLKMRVLTLSQDEDVLILKD